MDTGLAFVFLVIQGKEKNDGSAKANGGPRHIGGGRLGK